MATVKIDFKLIIYIPYLNVLVKKNKIGEEGNGWNHLNLVLQSDDKNNTFFNTTLNKLDRFNAFDFVSENKDIYIEFKNRNNTKNKLGWFK